MRERNYYSKLKMDKNRGRYLKPLRYPNIPLSTSDMYVNTVVGDRLDLMADQFYNDPRLWWLIAQANPDKLRRDSYSVSVGLEIRIPGGVNNILNQFKILNK